MPPAARIGDLHVCPLSDGPKPHVGGPVSMGCPTVMIGFLPAARVGDMCVCVGPPDSIAKGSPTVKIGGMMAARMGDLTAHGGTITFGSPTVMIGDVGMGAAVMGGSAGALGTIASAECKALTDAIDKLDGVSERASLAADIYNTFDPTAAPGRPPAPLPAGYTRLSDDPQKMRDFFKGRLSDQEIKNLTAPENSSYRADIYQNGEGKTFVVYRGTENKEGRKDWKVNFSQGSGFNNEHYESAKELGVVVADIAGPGNVEFIGHSKGGGMAAAAGTVTGAKTTTFNSAGLHPNTVEGHDLSKAGANIDSYVVDGEVLNWAQDNGDIVKSTITGLAATIVGPLTGIGTAILIKDTIPPSVGNRHPLPAVWKPGQEPSWYDPVMFRVTLHGMDKVNEGLQSHRDDLIESYNDQGCPAQLGPR